VVGCGGALVYSRGKYEERRYTWPLLRPNGRL
jgi:hypothetical protein